MFKNPLKSTAATFEPSTEIFPPIDVGQIASKLGLEQAGSRDGASEMPSSSSTSLSSIELKALDEISRRRKRALDDHHRHFNAYQRRVDASVGAVENIEGIAGKLCNEMIAKSKSQRNIVKNALRGVQDRNIGEQSFKNKHNIQGPPREAKPTSLMILGLFTALVVEVVLAGAFFAEKNTSGLMGGLSTALMLTIVNVLFCLLCGLGSRFVNLTGIGNKLIGVVCMLGFLLMSLGFNLLVAHFRDALDGLPWEQAAGAALQSLRENPLGIDSFNAVIISLFGFLVSLIGFIEGRIWFDPHPGYNAVYENVDTAFDDYSDAFEEAHNELDELYENHKKELNGESARLRGLVRNAASAELNQLRLAENFSEFCISCDQAVRSLLSIYRESNSRSRSTPSPDYFSEINKLEKIKLDVDVKKTSAHIETQLKQIDIVAKESIQRILNARREELDTLPTIEEVLDKLHGYNANSYQNKAEFTKDETLV